jgi:sortase A
MRRVAQSVSVLLIAVGVGVVAWAATVWLWQDPFTLLLNRHDQRQLSSNFDRRLEEGFVAPAASGRRVGAAAARWRKETGRGDALARIRIPALGLSAIVVEGTDHDSLERGPGHYLGSGLPGQGELIYVAGHRTTYGAPFSRIDHLVKGDRVTLEVPYGTFTYAVTGHRIVPATQTSVLKSKGFEQLALQACHPRFFATHRYIVYAKPLGMVAPERPETSEASG